MKEVIFLCLTLLCVGALAGCASNESPALSGSISAGSSLPGERSFTAGVRGNCAAGRIFRRHASRVHDDGYQCGRAGEDI